MRRLLHAGFAIAILAMTPGLAVADVIVDCPPPESNGVLSQLSSVLDDVFGRGGATDTGADTDTVPEPPAPADPEPEPETLTNEWIAENGRTLDVPWRKQSGPKCGFYALGMVLDFYKESNPEVLNPPVEGDEGMFKWAVDEGLTTTGGLFDYEVAKVARQYGYEAESLSSRTGQTPPTMQTLRDAVNEGVPAMVAFDVDHSGNAGDSGGQRGHWAVVEGFYTANDGTEYMIVKHGWRGESYVWKVADFEPSWAIHRRQTVLVRPAD